MIKAAHIRTDSTHSFFEYDPKEGSSLEMLQARVGGYIEAAPIFDRRLTMYCNEEGKLQGLPVNRLATILLDHGAHDVIVGDVVLVGGADVEGYDTSLPRDVQIALGETREKGGGDDEPEPKESERPGKEGR